jgi:hypothetical protein
MKGNDSLVYLIRSFQRMGRSLHLTVLRLVSLIMVIYSAEAREVSYGTITYVQTHPRREIVSSGIRRTVAQTIPKTP